MKLKTESTLAQVAECLTNLGEDSTLVQLNAEAYLVVFPWVDTGDVGFDTSRLFQSDDDGELSAREVRETVKARAAVQEALSNADAYLLPLPNEGKQTLTVGRAQTNDLTVNSSSVSKLHALILKQGPTGWTLRDNDSTNGTTHNDEPVPAQTDISLDFGDTLEFGGVQAAFCDARGVIDLAERHW